LISDEKKRLKLAKAPLQGRRAASRQDEKARRQQDRERERARAAWEKFSAKKQRPGSNSQALLLRGPDGC
jgi:hypothetical protein